MTKASGRRVHRTIHHQLLTGVISTQMKMKRVMMFWLFHGRCSGGQRSTWQMKQSGAPVETKWNLSFHHSFAYLWNMSNSCVFLSNSHSWLQELKHRSMQNSVTSMPSPTNLKYVAFSLSLSLFWLEKYHLWTMSGPDESQLPHCVMWSS